LLLTPLSCPPLYSVEDILEGGGRGCSESSESEVGGGSQVRLTSEKTLEVGYKEVGYKVGCAEVGYKQVCYKVGYIYRLYVGYATQSSTWPI